MGIFNSMQDYYRTGYLYGIDDKNGELAMKVLEYKGKVFGIIHKLNFTILLNLLKQVTENPTLILLFLFLQKNYLFY